MSDNGSGSQEQSTERIVSALEALTAQVAKLTDAVVALQSSSPNTNESQSTPVQPALSVMPQPSRVPMPQDPDEDASFKDVDLVIAGLFLAGLDPDPDAGFEAYLELMHSDRIDAPRSIPSLKEFNWKSLRKNLPSFLSDPADGSSFKVVSRRPDTLSAETTSVKVFLESRNRSPVPVTFKRDPAKHDLWRVTDSSL